MVRVGGGTDTTARKKRVRNLISSLIAKIGQNIYFEVYPSIDRSVYQNSIIHRLTKNHNRDVVGSKKSKVEKRCAPNRPNNQ